MAEGSGIWGEERISGYPETEGGWKERGAGTREEGFERLSLER